MLECTRCGFRGNADEYIRHALSCLAICATCRQHVSVAGYHNHDCHLVVPPLPEDIPVDPGIDSF
ncbi:hypothetical protein CAEBREN_16160 [Caenorhabditis brenneri]|uniref:Uncharacterized protein n=1 Tax=Caenorhabditis brenneri TaxID=135651 RepID=G0PKM2_CAEBE|nr:hypothetical protein CAEBREN_16160 [Caenorhabditis brenneri]